MCDLTSRREPSPTSARACNDSRLETLEEELNDILGERRVWLSGMRALFNFRTIAVFTGRSGHLHGRRPLVLPVSLARVSVASTPGMAAFYCIARPRPASRRLIALPSRHIRPTDADADTDAGLRP